jgi:hypothetical protein
MKILEYWAPKGVAFTLYYPAYDGEWSSQYVTSPAGLDSEASIDKAAFADCTNEWTEIGSSGVGYLDLTADEMDNDEVVVQTASTTEGVNFPLVVIRTYVPLSNVFEGSLTEQDFMRLVLSALCNKANGGGTDTISFRDLADLKNRLVMTVDSDGNRSAVVKDGS